MTDGSREDGRESAAALAYVVAVAALATGLTVPALASLHANVWEWGTFALLAACACLGQRLAHRHGAGPADGSLTFLVAAALLLPPGLAALVGIAQHSLELALDRGSARRRVLDVSRSALAGLAASLAAHHVAGTSSAAAAGEGRWALAGLVAVAVAFAVDRLLAAGLVAVEEGRAEARRSLVSPRTGGELLLASIGVGIAALWSFDPWLVPFAVAPVLVVHRSLHVPALEEQMRLDAKTSLYNARHFDDSLRVELARAKRIGARLSVAMADLDFLRDVNNTHGHLAGDAVLEGVAEVFRLQLRPYDLAARFGGEEFAILLPETSRETALETAERIRAAVAACEFPVGPDGEPIRITVSIGVASFPEDASRAEELVHRADLAAYRAKVQGRNRVVLAGDEPAPRLALAPRNRPEELAEAAAGPPFLLRVPRRIRRPTREESVALLLAALSFLGVAALVVGAMAGAPRIALALGGVAVLCVLLARRRQTAAAELVRTRAQKLWRAADALHARTVSAERANRDLRDRSALALARLSAVVDARDAHTVGHSERVRRVALAIGAELGMSGSELEVLGHAALFHDIGKLTIPEAILLKPAGLDRAEWGLVRQYPAEGARLVGELGFLEDALPSIRHHHERYEGSGYPDHLRGEEIPLGARIIHVADALDAMTTERVYRPARTASEALEELRLGAGSQFCPRCVAALDRLLLNEFVEAGHAPYALLARS